MTLTPRNLEVFDMIRAYLIEKGTTPAISDICEHFEFSPNAAAIHINKLEQAGRLTKIKGRIALPNITQQLSQFYPTNPRKLK